MLFVFKYAFFLLTEWAFVSCFNFRKISILCSLIIDVCERLINVRGSAEQCSRLLRLPARNMPISTPEKFKSLFQSTWNFAPLIMLTVHLSTPCRIKIDPLPATRCAQKVYSFEAFLDNLYFSSPRPHVEPLNQISNYYLQ
jgi:hypothetical protein